MNDIISEIDCIRVNGDERDKKRETIAVEKEMQLIVNDQPVTNFLYSPGLDKQLVVGYLLSSGLISDLNDIERIEVGEDVSKVWVSQREDRESVVQDVGLTISHRQLNEIRARLLDNQKHHRATRGFHGAILWELSTGKWFVCEDIGRHNTVDKLSGLALMQEIDTRDQILLSSGRVSSEMLNKAAKMGVPIIVSRTSPTSLSVALAQAWGITLVGYARQRRMNVYAGAERLQENT